MKSIRTAVAAIALTLAALTAGPGELLAQQMYECTTTTTTTTSYKTLDDGTTIKTTLTISQTVCVPIDMI